MGDSSEDSLANQQIETFTRVSESDSHDASGESLGEESLIADHANNVVDITPIDRLSRTDSQKHELGPVALPRRRKSPKRRPSGLTGLSEPLLDDDGGDLDALPWEDGGNGEPEPEGRVGWVYASAMVCCSAHVQPTADNAFA